MKVVVFRGVPGSGKSTLARKMADDCNAVPGNHCATIYSADHFFEDDEGIYRFDREKLAEAHADCLRKFTLDLKCSWEWPNPKDILIVDNTNTTPEEVAPYAQLAKAFGAELEVVTVDCDQGVAFRRQTHGVPANTHLRMHARLVSSTKRISNCWPHREVRT